MVEPNAPTNSSDIKDELVQSIHETNKLSIDEKAELVVNLKKQVIIQRAVIKIMADELRDQEEIYKKLSETNFSTYK
jgi:hypothetical protein